jgi:AbrB family looped-hinge helix DNA binding protein
MAKVTSKLQITIPKRLAEQYKIAPGDDLEFVPAGDGIRLVPARAGTARGLSPEERLRLFDEASARQRARDQVVSAAERSTGRGWTREDLYDRCRHSPAPRSR